MKHPEYPKLPEDYPKTRVHIVPFPEKLSDVSVTKWANGEINPTESDGRGYRCLHCEVRNGVQFCHYTNDKIVSLPDHECKEPLDWKRESKK